MEKDNRRQFNFIDLFAGCGGLSEGFLQSGHFDSLAHVEWELPMVHTLRHRLHQKWGRSEAEAVKEVIHFDIQKTDELIWGDWTPESLNKYASNNDLEIARSGLKGLIGNKHVDVIIGGPPCQAYSIHGRATDKNSMKDDYRNYLFESFAQVVAAFTPDVFVFENVPGMLSAKPGEKLVTERIYQAFKEIGYDILSPSAMSKAIFDASEYQVPQNRKRVIIIGVKSNGHLELESFYKAFSKEKSSHGKVTVRDAIGWLPKIFPLSKSVKVGRGTISHQVQKSSYDITQHEPRFQGMREVEAFKRWVSEGMNSSTHKKKIEFYYKVTGRTTLYAKYKNLEWDKPSHTIVAHLSKDGYMFIHPDPEQARSITIREAAILMTFPLDYQFLGSSPYRFKMIGNAVPVLFAKSIATAVSKVIRNEHIDCM